MADFIFVVGPMGAGKSTIGRLLAEERSLPFIDTDAEIEARAGADIPWIFDVEGEDGFRQRESNVLADICDGVPAVIATGGGIVIKGENRALIRESGRTVYLHASVEQQLSRTGKDKARPLLNVENREQVLSELMTIREPLYRELADIVYQTDDRNPRIIAREINTKL